MQIMKRKKPSPNRASRFFFRRNQASLQREEPCTSPVSGAAVVVSAVDMGLTQHPNLTAGPRIHAQLKQVRDKIEKHDQSAIENDGTEDQRIIPIENRLDKLLTETRNIEHLFHNERTGY